MKKRILSSLLVLSMSIAHLPVSAQSNIPEHGEEVNGFKVVSITPFDAFDADVVLFEHKKTGAEVLYCANDDINRAFGIAFKTPALNNSGTTHIFEHSTLAGSEKYPSSTLWMKLLNQSYNTFMNAMTGQNVTVYPVSSLSEEQLYQLTDYYLDSVFNPMIYTDDSIFDREAWHYELESADSPLTIDGTVYNEMLGSKTIENESIMNLRKALYPGSYSSNNSGGDPYSISDITNEDLIEYHTEYYTPSNSLTVLYGDVDYESFLGLFDSYFADYDEEEIDIDFAGHDSLDRYITEEFEFPVSQDDTSDAKTIITYGMECDGIEPHQLANLEITLKIIMGYINTAIMEKLPGVSLSYYIDSDSAKPTVVFIAENADSTQAEKFKEIVDDVIQEIINFGASPEVVTSVLEAVKRTEAMSFEGENIGTSIISNTASQWAVFDDADYYFHYVETFLDEKNDSYNETAKAYARQFLKPIRSALVTTVPSPGLAEKSNAEFEEKLQTKKLEMTPDEIGNIISNTEDFDNYTGEENAELDKELIEKICVVDVKDFPEEITEYEITDTEIDGVRYINAVADIEEIGKGRIMIDVSDFQEDELHWLSLYSMLIGSVDSEKYTKEEISSRIGLYADCSTDLMTVNADNENGLTPYLIFKYEGFADKSERIFAMADEILFHPDFSDREYIKSLIDIYKNSFESSVRNNGYSYLANRVMASKNRAAWYLENTSGLSMYGFIKSLYTDGYSEDDIIEKLNQVKEKIANKNGACIVYSGNQESIEKNTKEAKRFFLGIESKEIIHRYYSLIYPKYYNKALVLDSSVNYNGIYAPADVIGKEYSGGDDVIMNYLQDRFFIPVFRDAYNAYGVSSILDETGLMLMTYSDPEMTNTFKIYSELSDMIENTQISQDELNKYISTVYSDYIMPRGELTDAYWAADDYMNGITYEDKIEILHEMKNTSVQEVEEYTEIFENAWNEGVIFTVGNNDIISENAHMFDEIINPFGYKLDYIRIDVDGKKLRTDTAAYIKNDRVMVPMRNIFEATEAEVSWNGETREVTAVKDGVTIVMAIDSNVINVDDNGEASEIILDCPVEITNDYTMIPLRAVSETLGYDVSWDGETKTVTVE